MNSLPLNVIFVPILCAVITFLNSIFLFITYVQNKDNETHTFHNPKEILFYFGISVLMFLYIFSQSILVLSTNTQLLLFFHRIQNIFLTFGTVLFIFLPETIFYREGKMKKINIIFSIALLIFLPFIFSEWYIISEIEKMEYISQGKENFLNFIHLFLMLISVIYVLMKIIIYSLIQLRTIQPKTSNKLKHPSTNKNIKIGKLQDNQKSMIIITCILILTGIIELLTLMNLLTLQFLNFAGISVGMTLSGLLITGILMKEYSQTIQKLSQQRLAIDRENHKIENEYKGLLSTISEIQERDDEYTGGHSQRVAEISGLLADALNLEEKLRNRIKTSALIHDIGKIGISKKTLNKPGKLTPEEYQDVQRHASLGYDIISQYQPFDEIAYYVRHHHEKINGTGYPDKISGKDIPYVDRILAVADIYDALHTKRPYRDALPLEQCISIMEDMADRGDIDIQILKTLNRVMNTGKLY